MSFENGVVLITGGAAGIGRVTALEFARQGARIAVADRDEEQGRAAVAEVQVLGGEAAFIAVDVADAASVGNMVDECVTVFGRIDCAVNNAGIELEWASLADADEQMFDRIIAVNLKGVWLCLRQEIRQMLTQGSGAIVNTASIAGLIAAPKMSSYAASKHGVIGLTKTAAVEYARAGIRINAVCPGVIDTDMTRRAIEKGDAGLAQRLPGIHPIGRVGTAGEVARAITWLCSDAAGFTTGVAFPVDGGRLAQ